MITALRIISIVILTFGLINCSNSNSPDKVEIQTQKPEKKFLASIDSFIVNTDKNAVYITSDTNSSVYERINKSVLSDKIIQSNIDGESIAEMEMKTGTNVRKNSTVGVPKRWIKLHKFEGEFFVYSPSDIRARAEILITDSILYRFNPTKVTLNLITKIEKKSNGSIYIGIENASQLVFGCELTPLAERPEIYHWKFFDSAKELFHEEYRVSLENTKKFRAIVNDCFGSRCKQEFQF